MQHLLLCLHSFFSFPSAVKNGTKFIIAKGESKLRELVHWQVSLFSEEDISPFLTDKHNSDNKTHCNH